MRNLKKILKEFCRRYWPLFVIIGIVFIFFWKVFLLNQFPLPADFIVGTYYPWLDYKWGFPAGVPVKNPITSDVVSVIFPIRMLGIDLIRQGKLPLWNPYMFAGYPLFANVQAALLSPTIFYYLFLPKLWAWAAQTITQPLLASIFTYMLLRHFKLNKLSSITGALIYAFSGFNTIWLEWNTHSLTAAFIPLILLTVDKMINETKIKYGIFLSVIITLQIFSGYPQLVIYTFIAILLLVFIRRKIVSVRGWFFIAFFIAFGIAMASVQLLPAYELLMESQRGTEQITDNLAFLPWQNLVAILAPDFFGNHTTGNFWGSGNYTNNTVYSGIIAFILALYALPVLWKKTEVKYFTLLAGVSLLISLPFPWTRWLAGTGVLGSSASSMTRIAVLFNLSIGVLAAFAINNLHKKRSSISFITYVPLTVLLAVFLFIKTAQKFGLYDAVLLSNFSVSERNLILPASLACAAALILYIHKRFFHKKAVRLGSLCIISTFIVLELLRFGWKYTPFSPKEFVFPETPTLNFLKNVPEPSRVITGYVIPMNMWLPYKLESLAGYDAAYPLSIAKYIAVANSGIAEASAHGRHGTVSGFGNNLTRLSNNKYYLVLKEEYNSNIALRSGNFSIAFNDKSVYVLEDSETLPKAFFVSDWEVRDRQEILGELTKKDYPYASKIIIEQTPGNIKVSENVKSKVDYIKYEGNESKIKIETDKDGMLFVSDTFYPGWKVYVDGVEEKIYRANYAFRAIIIPKGSHIVEFKYEPESFYNGIKLSIASLVLFIITSGILVRWQKKGTELY